jgi:hypothetical protein
MPRSHNIVELIAGLDETGEAPASFAARSAKPAGNLVTIRFANDEKAHLNLSEQQAAVWLSVLRSLREQGTPPYVEVDGAGRITKLLQPKLQPVVDIQPLDDARDLRVELGYSHAMHVLRRKNPRYQELLSMLREAQRKKTSVWITETLDAHEIIDVRADNLKGRANIKPSGG